MRLSDLLAQWRPDWLTIAVLAGLVMVWARARLRLRGAGRPWPPPRDVAFVVGVVLTLWSTSGFLEARGAQLMWVWTIQVLLLSLVVPVVLVAAQPVTLARAAYGPTARPLRMLRSRPARLLGHPALGLLYVPVANGLLFFGGVGAFTLRYAPAGWGLHLVLLVLGTVIALPLLDLEDDRTSLAVGLSVAIAVVELLLDAIPGIVLRLETHLQIPLFEGHRPPWSPSWLSDQQTAGAILWTVAELLDMPFLILAIRQWIRIDRREASHIDAELDRAEATRGAAGTAHGENTPGGARPWWLDHPELRTRYGRNK